jgi:hypothetical protein
VAATRRAIWRLTRFGGRRRLRLKPALTNSCAPKTTRVTRLQLPATGTKRRTGRFRQNGRRMRWKMSDAPLIRLIRAEMQRFTAGHYEIAFDQIDTKSLQELLRFLLDAEYEHEVPRSAAQPGIPRRANRAEIEARSRAA